MLPVAKTKIEFFLQRRLLRAISAVFPAMVFLPAVHAQPAAVIGIVRDARSHEPLPGVNVTVNSLSGTATDPDGRYTLQLDAGTYRLSYSFVGYATRSDSVVLGPGEARIRNVDLVPAAGELQTVVVSASRFEQRLEDVTVSMAVIKPSLIDNLHAPTVEAAVEQVPGVTIIDGQANIRGGSGFSYGAGSRVMLLVDDLPMLAADANDVKWSFLPVENIAQVEIIKGASSALFGSSAMNGVINIRTASPGPAPSTKVMAYRGVFDSPRNENLRWWGNIAPGYSGMRFFHSRRLNRVDLTIGGDMYDEEGYREHEYEYRTRFNAGVRFRPARWERVSFGFNTNLYHTNGNLFLLWRDDTTGALVPQPGTLSGYTTVRESLDPYFTYVSRNNGTHKVRTRYFRTDNANTTRQESVARLYYAEYQYQRKWADRLTVTAGMADAYATVTSELYGDHRSNNFAVFVQGDFAWQRWVFSAGGRVEQNRIDDVRGDAIPVFRSGVNYRLFDHTRLRASFGQGYRFPSIAEKYIRTHVGSLEIYPNDSIGPEKGFSAEVGLNQGFKVSEWRGSFDMAAFWSEYHDMMEFTFGPFGDPVPPLYGLGFKSVNIGNTRIQGLDVAVTGEGYAGRLPLKLMAGFTVIYPVSTTFNAAEDTLKHNSADYNILKYRYRRLLKADAETGWGRWTAGLSVRYNSFMENIDKFFEEAIAGVRHYRETHPGGDWVFDGRLFTQLNKRWQAGLIVKNLTNHEYVSRPADMQPPRTFIVQVRVEF